MRALMLIVMLSACLDEPLADDPPTAHVIASWDPLACGAPHRVVVELADSTDTPLSASAPCTLAELVFDTPHFGDYNGRIYAYAPGMPDRSESPVELVVDQPIVHWPLETPR
jgi:hypothetical protein